MPVDPALIDLAQVIESEEAWPRPLCPKCSFGYIRFAEPIVHESYESSSLHSHDYFDPEWIHGTFAILGECENPNCHQNVHGTGDYTVDYSRRRDYDPNSGPPYVQFFTLTHLHPPMLLMPIPESAPESVRDGVLRASRVLFADPGLAATALRATVELFLTSQGFSGTTQMGRYRSAESRIAAWLASDQERAPAAELLRAVKWLGNAGTHEDSDLSAAEVLEGAKMLDEAFHRLFTGRNIDARALTINAARGPLRNRPAQGSGTSDTMSP